MPEVDGVLGTGSYYDVVPAVQQLLGTLESQLGGAPAVVLYVADGFFLGHLDSGLLVGSIQVHCLFYKVSDLDEYRDKYYLNDSKKQTLRYAGGKNIFIFVAPEDREPVGLQAQAEKSLPDYRKDDYSCPVGRLLGIE